MRAAALGGAGQAYGIDPINLQIAQLVASDAQPDDFLGNDVALSADGNYLAVGAGGDDDVISGGGAVYIFKRTAGSWAQQAKIVTPVSQLIPIGGSLSLSDDGGTLAIGHVSTGGGTQRGVWVYTRAGSIWSLQATVNPSVSSASFGVSVSLSADGNTLVVGAPDQTFNAAAGAGAVFVFNRSAGIWTETIRTGRTGAVASEALGSKVAISGDGNTFVATHGIGLSAKRGVVFALSGTWAQQSPLAGGAAGASTACAISTDGNTIITSESGYDTPQSNCGRLEIWTRSGAAWSLGSDFPQSKVPQASEGIGTTSISMSGDAQYIVCSASNNPDARALLFRKNGPTYTHIYQSATGAAGAQSRYCTISRDGTTFVNGTDHGDPPSLNDAGYVSVYTTVDNL